MNDTWAIDIVWDPDSNPELPTLIGPFNRPSDGKKWAHLNVMNGAWALRRMAWPSYNVREHR